MRLGKERWKRLVFPDYLQVKRKFQISNYGRVREKLPCGTYLEKLKIIKDFRISYKFVLPGSVNSVEKHLYVESAKQLVARHFLKNYYPGCYIIQKDHNRLNNYFRNLEVTDKNAAYSHFAIGKVDKYDQFLVVPPEPEPAAYEVVHKVEIDREFFKTLPEFPNYEINRRGVIRRRKAPGIGRIMKPRLHPDKFYFVELRNPLRQRKTVYIHKAVATVWNINSDPENQTIVVHLDGDTTNNHSDNLEWMSPGGAMKLQFAQNKRDNRKSWKTRKKRYGNGFKEIKKNLVK